MLTDLEKMTFIEYLQKADLTESLIQYVLLCIAMTDGSATALEVNIIDHNHVSMILYIINLGSAGIKVVFKIFRTIW